MTLLSKHRNAVRRENRTYALLDGIIVGLVIATVLWTLLCLGACTPGTRTRVDPAATNATHETRSQRPGRVKTRTLEVEIVPGGEKPSGIRDQGSGIGEKPSGIRDQGSGIGGEEIRTAPGTASTGTQNFTTTLAAYRPPVGAADAGTTGVSGLSPVVLARWPWGSEEADQTVSEAKSDPIAEAVRDAAGKGNTVRYKFTETDEIPLTTDESSSTLDDRGAGLNTSSDEAAIGFEGGKSGAGLPWGSKGGKTSWGLDASLISKGPNALHLIGAIVMLAAIVPLWSPPRRWVAAGCIAGVGLLIVAAGTVSEQAPWVFVLAILAFLGLAIWQGVEMWRNKRRELALTSIAKGVEGSPHPGEVKDKIAKAAGEKIDTVKAEVSAIKRKARLRSSEEH